MRAFDVVVSVLLLVLLAPLALLAAIAIVCESRGGVLYRSRRLGLGGRWFTMWQFRTMRPIGGSPVTWPDDPRVTLVGRVLRRLGLDDWPQLWNVLRGEMRLVGPRPQNPSMVDLEDPRWQRILSVPPGITGPTQLHWAHREQVLLRGRSTLELYRHHILPLKLASDVRYVETRAPLRDALILLEALVVPFRPRR